MNTSCLRAPDPNVRTISLNQCGNGIVEEGEDCDPGSGVNSTCCNSQTCKFNAGALCDPSSSACCTDQCGFAPATTVCRAARDVTCDVAETCTGTSASCPSDTFATNGLSCGANGLKCAGGICTSPDRKLAYFTSSLCSCRGQCNASKLGRRWVSRLLVETAVTIRAAYRVRAPVPLMPAWCSQPSS